MNGCYEQENRKVIGVESDVALREQIVLALTDAGYEVSTNYQEGMKAVLAFNSRVNQYKNLRWKSRITRQTPEPASQLPPYVLYS